MAGRQPALVALVLLAVALLGPMPASGKKDIVGAVTKRAAKMRGAGKIAIGGGKSAEPLAGGSTLGVKGGSPKQHLHTKKCGTATPTDEELAAVQPLMDAAAKFSADEDAARSGAALLWMSPPMPSTSTGPAVFAAVPGCGAVLVAAIAPDQPQLLVSCSA